MVLESLRLGPATPDQLVPLIYSRLSPSLAVPAAASVWAHLRRLDELGQAESEDRNDRASMWTAV
jgi:hypothetical protein